MYFLGGGKVQSRQFEGETHACVQSSIKIGAKRERRRNFFGCLIGVVDALRGSDVKFLDL